MVVLPFANMSGDPQQGPIVDGITMDLITGCRKALRPVRDRPQLDVRLQGKGGEDRGGGGGKRRSSRARTAACSAPVIRSGSMRS